MPRYQMMNHYCPDLSPNSTRPNMYASSCAARVKSKGNKCSTCKSGIGYVPPVKVEKKPIAEKFKKIPVKSPKEKKVKNKDKVKKQYHKRIETCACGSPREFNKKYCALCHTNKRAVSVATFKLKALLVKRVALDKKIAAMDKIISG